MISGLPLQKAQPYVLAVAAGTLIGGLSLVSPFAALGIVLASIFLLTTLRYPVVVCCVLALAIPLVSGIVRGKLVPLLRPNELLLIAAVGFALFIILTNKDRWSNLRASLPILAAFCVLAIGTIIIPIGYHTLQGNETSIDGMMDTFAPVKFLLLFMVFLTLPTKDTHWYAIIACLLVGSAIISVVGFLQAANVGPVMTLLNTWYASDQASLAVEEGGGRITSLMGAWNALGMLLAAAVAIGWAALQVPGMRPYRAVIAVSLVLSFLCLLASGSFAGLFSAVVSIIIVETLTNPIRQTIKRLSTALLISTASFLIVLPLIWGVIESRLMWQFNDGDNNLLPQTFVYRFWIWDDVFWPEIVRNPIFGTSLEIYASYRWMAAESHYMSLLFRFGIVGLISHIIWVAIMLVWTYRQAQRGDQLSKMMGVTAVALLIVLMFASVTNEVFIFTGIIDYLWILFALVANRKGNTLS